MGISRTQKEKPQEYYVHLGMEIWDEVIKEYNQEINNLRLALGNGSAEDYSHYRQLVGSISSLEWARDNLTDIIKKRMYMEDED